jgi:hypothetical protein
LTMFEFGRLGCFIFILYSFEESCQVRHGVQR